MSSLVSLTGAPTDWAEGGTSWSSSLSFFPFFFFFFSCTLNGTAYTSIAFVCSASATETVNPPPPTDVVVVVLFLPLPERNAKDDIFTELLRVPTNWSSSAAVMLLRSSPSSPVEAASVRVYAGSRVRRSPPSPDRFVFCARGWAAFSRWRFSRRFSFFVASSLERTWNTSTTLPDDLTPTRITSSPALLLIRWYWIDVHRSVETLFTPPMNRAPPSA
mmetsp:Transcript_4588/g.5493  ORF Transcript_4588/g.5493 Transcript_4588/m.5493 type:complete len:218 (+) Transcript_4588:2001-2654(+)